MIDERIEELMWLEIDETISPADRETLHPYLNANGEARGLRRLLRMAQLFGQMGEIDPPAELRSGSFGPSRPPRRRGAKSAGFADRLGALFSPRPVWRFAAVGAAGIVIGVIGYHLIRTGAERGTR